MNFRALWIRERLERIMVVVKLKFLSTIVRNGADSGVVTS